MTSWKITGIVATLIIILTPALYLVKVTVLPLPNEAAGRRAGATFVGHQKCIECHKKEYQSWHQSDHDHAMEEATETSVRGNFNNTVFEHAGVTSRFYRRDGKFLVHTQGPGGTMGDFQITHTFGWYPLQQYLAPFPGGRLQCLPIAWDVEQKRWFHLYPDEEIDPQDWLYWTNAGQNWNGMCAECHSTNLKKNYNVNNDTFQTTWSEIDVSCEACHGPGSLHVKWAEMPAMARPEEPNYGLTVRTHGLSSGEQVALCAYCHARRSSLEDFKPANRRDLLDIMLPRTLDEGMYFADGQILEEVYVYGSFTQSKMYDRDVRCSDCHDVHSTKRIKEGNALCLQCHREKIYDNRAHHFHKKKGEKGEPIKSAVGKVLFEVGSGAQCEQCHMPGRHYMGIDYRPDHSLRIPRPDLTVSIGVPNACNRCHADKSAQWSLDYVTKWHGTERRFHYGSVIAAGRRSAPQARGDLIRLADDRLYPTLVRATALSLLAAYNGEEVLGAFGRALQDETSLMRHTALHFLPPLPTAERMAMVGPLLDDPVKGVRIEAARNLTAVAENQLHGHLKEAFEAALQEFRQSMEYSADFAANRLNLGALYAYLGQPQKAEENFKKAVQIDRDFYQAQINLAVIYSQQGKIDQAETLLRNVLKTRPRLADVNYSLGLLLAEKKQYAEAAEHLQASAQGLPYNSRVHYNLGQLLAYLRHDRRAEAALLRALELEPDDIDYLTALAEFYIRREKLAQAKEIAQKMATAHPSSPMGAKLLNFINKKSSP